MFSKSSFIAILGILSFPILWTSCSESGPQDNQTSGSIKISIDETYQPVMEEQLKIFKARYPDARIQVEYKPEADCFKDFFEDTTRVIFVTRELTEEEKQYCLSKQIVPKSLAMARDAIAFITAKNSKDSNFTLRQIRDIVAGTTTNGNYQIVFDNQSSSTVRYMTDSLLKGKTISKNTFATKNSEEVINYVAANPTAIGVVGVSWVADRTDSLTEQFLSKVRVAGIMPDSGGVKNYVRPYQAYIGLQEYPCTRNFYFISKETWIGLGTGLVNYLCRDGQLVFKQAKMFPLRVNVLLRDTKSIQ